MTRNRPRPLPRDTAETIDFQEESMDNQSITIAGLLVTLVAGLALVLWAEVGFPGIQPWMYPLLVLLALAGIGVAAVRLA